MPSVSSAVSWLSNGATISAQKSTTKTSNTLGTHMNKWGMISESQHRFPLNSPDCVL